MTERRTFKVTEVLQSGKKERGCKTKFSKSLIYTGSRPSSAAKKAFSSLCARKRIKGVCSMFVTVRESTRGSSNKSFTYECKKKLLKGDNVKKIIVNGNVITFKHAITAKALKGPIKGRAPKCKQSRGRMLGKRSPKKRSPRSSGFGWILGL